ncbi:MAG: hypothetical protein K2O70_01185 [Desulfovibrionaceae bacterium]|nr:hypothetical protein [Desulfovibrionaceae bacterium]
MEHRRKNYGQTVHTSVETVAARAGLPPLQECVRLRLKAVTLPCGEREECNGCPKIRPLEPGDKVCPKCRGTFTPKVPTQKYCSKDCQKAAIRENA